MAEKPKKKLTKAQKAKKKKQRIILFAVEAVALVVLLVALYFVSKYSKMEHTDIDESELVINEEMVVPEAVDEEEISTNEGLGNHMNDYWNIALFGVDSRKGALGKGTLSDTIIIASINKTTKEVRLASVFRDTYLNIGNDSYSKANSAYAKGGPVQGINMLNMNFDLNITDYATVG